MGRAGRVRRADLDLAHREHLLAAQVWSISEQQTGVDPARSAVAAVSAVGRSDA